MQSKHLVTGGVPASLIAALVATTTRGRVHLTTDEAVYYGGLAFALGTSIAARVEQYGISGLFTGLWRGQAGKPSK